MKRDLSFSVCLASYNGEKYIREQIETILKQLSSADELIVSDDGSIDGTLNIVEELQNEHENIIIVKGPQMGFSCNFGNAVSYAKGDIVLFSDQDDLWDSSKVDIVYKCFKSNPDCTTILHKMTTFRDDASIDTNEIPITYHSGICRNFIKSSYWGCCMAVRRTFILKFMPFRNYCVGHDQLIGLMTEKYGRCCFIHEKLIKHRLHNTNTSNARTISEMVLFRKELMKDYYTAKVKYLTLKKAGT